MPNPYGQLVDTSKSGGLTVGAFWVQLFVWNEHCWEMKPEFVLTDLQLADLTKLAFPGRAWSKALTAAGTYRAGYNRGELTGRKVPKVKSFKYTLEGGTRLLRWTAGTPRSLWPAKLVVPAASSVQVCDVLSGKPMLTGQ